MRTLDFFERELTKFFAVCSFIFLSVAAFAPVVGDYCPYLQQWHNISLGIDPWVDNQFQALHHIPWYSFCGHFYVSAPNAYGPLFNIYGLTSLIFPTIPRVIGCVLFLIIVWKIATKVRARQDLDSTVRIWLYAGLFGNILSFPLVTIVGGNDVYIAFFICAALFALLAGNRVLAGAALGLGALIKFYPLYLVPFLALDRRRLDMRFAIAAFAIFIAGMGLGYLEWGPLIFKPFSWNLGRPASRSSFIFVLDACLQALFHLSVPASRLIWMTLAPAAAAALILQYKLRLSRLTGFMIGYIIILIFNHISYPEYYFPLMLALYIYFLNENPSPPLTRALAILFVMIVFNAAFFTLVTNYMKEALSGVRVAGCVIVTLIDVYIIAELIIQNKGREGGVLNKGV